MTKKFDDIKDKTPCQDTIRELEHALDQAKKGELRSIVLLKGYNDDSFCHCWSIDPRNSQRRMLAEFVMAQTDFTHKISLSEGDNIFAQAVTDE